MPNPAPLIPAPATRAPWYTLVTGIAILAGFAWICWFMLYVAAPKNAADQFPWERVLLVFNSIQTMAAAAAGALLGTSVQQARVASAELRAQQNEEGAGKADAARRAIANLRPPGATAQQDADEKLRAVAAALS